MATNRTIERIRKLRALADSTTFDAEAVTARRLATHLMQLYGVTEVDLSINEAIAVPTENRRNWNSYVQHEAVILYQADGTGYYPHVSYRKESPHERNANAARNADLWSRLRIDPRLR